MPWTPVPRLCPTPWTVKGLVKRKGRDCGEYCSRRRCRASSSSSSEFSSSDARTMSMQMIGRRSISVPGCDQNFPATGGSGGSSALSPRPPPPLPPPPPPSLGPARDKRGPAPVDNGPMALRMQAQGSALFEFVAFCLCLSAATPPPLLHLFPPTLALAPPVPRPAVPFLRLFVLLPILFLPILAAPFCKLQSPICRPFVSLLFFHSVLQLHR